MVKGTDGWHGWPAAAPYDAIHVGAAAKSMPQCLVDQLKVQYIKNILFSLKSVLKVNYNNVFVRWEVV